MFSEDNLGIYYHNIIKLFSTNTQMKGIVKYAIINSLGTAIYITLIVSFIYSLGNFFPGPDKKTILIPVAMLMLFVFSAAVTGFLVLGRPVIWYLNGKKREALSLLFYTLGIFLIIIFIVFFFLIILVN